MIPHDRIVADNNKNGRISFRPKSTFSFSSRGYIGFRSFLLKLKKNSNLIFAQRYIIHSKRKNI